MESLANQVGAEKLVKGFGRKNPLETACTKWGRNCVKVLLHGKSKVQKLLLRCEEKILLVYMLKLLKLKAIVANYFVTYATIFFCYLICIALPATAAC